MEYRRYRRLPDFYSHSIRTRIKTGAFKHFVIILWTSIVIPLEQGLRQKSPFGYLPLPAASIVIPLEQGLRPSA